MTPGQMKVYNFIRSHIAEHGYSPSYQVIADAMGFKNRSQAYHYVLKLVDHGLLRKDGSAGGIHLVEDDRDRLIMRMSDALKCAIFEAYCNAKHGKFEPAERDQLIKNLIPYREVSEQAEAHIRARTLTELARTDAKQILEGK